MKNKFQASLASRLHTSCIEFLLKRLTSRVLPVGSEEWRYMRCSFSQFGEDLLVVAALEDANRKGPAYYVDVGAYDPIEYSNTLLLSKMGWEGINIDPNPRHAGKFRALRPRDTNLEVAVAETQGRRNFLLYTNDLTNSLATPGENGQSVLGFAPKSKIQVETLPLVAILDRHLPPGSTFGFLNVDCEGFDLEVLKTNDWSRYRPWVIAVEDLPWKGSDVESFCKEQGYRLFARANITKIFLRSD